MPARKTQEPIDTQEAHFARFIEAARDLGCDQSEEASIDKLRKVAKAKPSAEATSLNDKRMSVR